MCVSEDIPSLEGAGKQIHAVKKLQGLEKVFLSTDAPIHGVSLQVSSPTSRVHFILFSVQSGKCWLTWWGAWSGTRPLRATCIAMVMEVLPLSTSGLLHTPNSS